ncbi:hypothetical protein K491DRAFT_694375 [Lophiostoma macrostomum CBS 122681]|uniref:Uncharacterized protein n=1 Tax=Lophiostoma macrostomum CBS 122681 TaxID=1314788 RepID=A0A6A6T4K8_9PLEO|nr:hypothetical protein K491DRAFT_694375 [Lophiostoma macrostomum CBS 122681]
MKLLTLFAFVVTTAAVALPEVSVTANGTEVASTQDKGVCSFQLSWRQTCRNGYPQSSVELPGFHNPDGLEHYPYKKVGSDVGQNGNHRWTLNGVLASPFVVREYDDPLRLVFEYQGCFWATNQGNGCGRCDVGDWAANWKYGACYFSVKEGGWRTCEMNCYIDCV